MSNPLSSVKLEFITRVVNDEVVPTVDPIEFIASNQDSKIKIISDIFTIPGSTADASITVTTHSDAILTIFFETGNTGDLTVKINGATNADKVAPRRIISGALTSLTVTNANASSVQIKIYTIIPVGTIQST